MNKQLGLYTQNYGMLCIVQYVADDETKIHKYKFTMENNIHFLEINTKSKSNGVEFEDNDDNVFLDKLIMSVYQFQLIEIPKIEQDQDQDQDQEEEDEDNNDNVFLDKSIMSIYQFQLIEIPKIEQDQEEEDEEDEDEYEYDDEDADEDEEGDQHQYQQGDQDQEEQNV